MKISVDVDCTPQELRTFFGLPDLEPMQQAVLMEMQQRMIAAMDHMTPTAVMKDWVAPMTAMPQALFGAFTSAASSAARNTGATGATSGRPRAGAARRRTSPTDAPVDSTGPAGMPGSPLTDD